MGAEQKKTHPQTQPYLIHTKVNSPELLNSSSSTDLPQSSKLTPGLTIPKDWNPYVSASQESHAGEAALLYPPNLGEQVDQAAQIITEQIKGYWQSLKEKWGGSQDQGQPAASTSQPSGRIAGYYFPVSGDIGLPAVILDYHSQEQIDKILAPEPPKPAPSDKAKGTPAASTTYRTVWTPLGVGPFTVPIPEQSPTDVPAINHALASDKVAQTIVSQLATITGDGVRSVKQSWNKLDDNDKAALAIIIGYMLANQGHQLDDSWQQALDDALHASLPVETVTHQTGFPLSPPNQPLPEAQNQSNFDLKSEAGLTQFFTQVVVPLNNQPATAKVVSLDQLATTIEEIRELNPDEEINPTLLVQAIELYRTNQTDPTDSDPESIAKLYHLFKLAAAEGSFALTAHALRRNTKKSPDNLTDRVSKALPTETPTPEPTATPMPVETPDLGAALLRYGQEQSSRSETSYRQPELIQRIVDHSVQILDLHPDAAQIPEVQGAVYHLVASALDPSPSSRWWDLSEPERLQRTQAIADLALSVYSQHQDEIQPNGFNELVTALQVYHEQFTTSIDQARGDAIMTAMKQVSLPFDGLLLANMWLTDPDHGGLSLPQIQARLDQIKQLQVRLAKATGIEPLYFVPNTLHYMLERYEAEAFEAAIPRIAKDTASGLRITWQDYIIPEDEITRAAERFWQTQDTYPFTDVYLVAQNHPFPTAPEFQTDVQTALDLWTWSRTLYRQIMPWELMPIVTSGHLDESLFKTVAQWYADPNQDISRTVYDENGYSKIIRTPFNETYTAYRKYQGTETWNPERFQLAHQIRVQTSDLDFFEYLTISEIYGILTDHPKITNGAEIKRLLLAKGEKAKQFVFETEILTQTGVKALTDLPVYLNPSVKGNSYRGRLDRLHISSERILISASQNIGPSYLSEILVHEVAHKWLEETPEAYLHLVKLFGSISWLELQRKNHNLSDIALTKHLETLGLDQSTYQRWQRQGLVEVILYSFGGEHLTRLKASRHFAGNVLGEPITSNFQCDESDHFSWHGTTVNACALDAKLWEAWRRAPDLTTAQKVLERALKTNSKKDLHEHAVVYPLGLFILFGENPHFIPGLSPELGRYFNPDWQPPQDWTQPNEPTLGDYLEQHPIEFSPDALETQGSALEPGSDHSQETTPTPLVTPEAQAQMAIGGLVTAVAGWWLRRNGKLADQKAQQELNDFADQLYNALMPLYSNGRAKSQAQTQRLIDFILGQSGIDPRTDDVTIQWGLKGKRQRPYQVTITSEGKEPKIISLVHNPKAYTSTRKVQLSSVFATHAVDSNPYQWHWLPRSGQTVTLPALVALSLTAAACQSQPASKPIDIQPITLEQPPPTVSYLLLNSAPAEPLPLNDLPDSSVFPPNPWSDLPPSLKDAVDQAAAALTLPSGASQPDRQIRINSALYQARQTYTALMNLPWTPQLTPESHAPFFASIFHLAAQHGANYNPQALTEAYRARFLLEQAAVPTGLLDNLTPANWYDLIQNLEIARAEELVEVMNTQGLEVKARILGGLSPSSRPDFLNSVTILGIPLNKFDESEIWGLWNTTHVLIATGPNRTGKEIEVVGTHEVLHEKFLNHPELGPEVVRHLLYTTIEPNPSVPSHFSETWTLKRQQLRAFFGVDDAFPNTDNHLYEYRCTNGGPDTTCFISKELQFKLLDPNITIEEKKAAIDTYVADINLADNAYHMALIPTVALFLDPDVKDHLPTLLDPDFPPEVMDWFIEPTLPEPESQSSSPNSLPEDPLAASLPIITIIAEHLASKNKKGNGKHDRKNGKQTGELELDPEQVRAVVPEIWDKLKNYISPKQEKTIVFHSAAEVLEHFIAQMLQHQWETGQDQIRALEFEQAFILALRGRDDIREVCILPELMLTIPDEDGNGKRHVSALDVAFMDNHGRIHMIEVKTTSAESLIPDSRAETRAKKQQQVMAYLHQVGLVDSFGTVDAQTITDPEALNEFLNCCLDLETEGEVKFQPETLSDHTDTSPADFRIADNQGNGRGGNHKGGKRVAIFPEPEESGRPDGEPEPDNRNPDTLETSSPDLSDPEAKWAKGMALPEALRVVDSNLVEVNGHNLSVLSAMGGISEKLAALNPPNGLVIFCELGFRVTQNGHVEGPVTDLKTDQAHPHPEKKYWTVYPLNSRVNGTELDGNASITQIPHPWTKDTTITSKPMKLEELEVLATFTEGTSYTITPIHGWIFNQSTGDKNAIHVDEAEAAKSGFGERIAAGILTTVLGLTGSHPANGANPETDSLAYALQHHQIVDASLSFLAAVKYGEAIQLYTKKTTLNGRDIFEFKIVKPGATEGEKILVMTGKLEFEEGVIQTSEKEIPKSIQPPNLVFTPNTSAELQVQVRDSIVKLEHHRLRTEAPWDGGGLTIQEHTPTKAELTLLEETLTSGYNTLQQLGIINPVLPQPTSIHWFTVESTDEEFPLTQVSGVTSPLGTGIALYIPKTATADQIQTCLLQELWHLQPRQTLTTSPGSNGNPHYQVVERGLDVADSAHSHQLKESILKEPLSDLFAFLCNPSQTITTPYPLRLAMTLSMLDVLARNNDTSVNKELMRLMQAESLGDQSYLEYLTQTLGTGFVQHLQALSVQSDRLENPERFLECVRLGGFDTELKAKLMLILNNQPLAYGDQNLNINLGGAHELSQHHNWLESIFSESTLLYQAFSPEVAQRLETAAPLRTVLSVSNQASANLAAMAPEIAQEKKKLGHTEVEENTVIYSYCTISNLNHTKQSKITELSAGPLERVPDYYWDKQTVTMLGTDGLEIKAGILNADQPYPEHITLPNKPLNPETLLNPDTGGFTEITSLEQLVSITQEQIEAYGKLSGDPNPLHLNEAHAQKTPFRTRIAHGARVQAEALARVYPLFSPNGSGQPTIAMVKTFFSGPYMAGQTLRIFHKALNEEEVTKAKLTVGPNQIAHKMVVGKNTDDGVKEVMQIYVVVEAKEAEAILSIANSTIVIEPNSQNTTETQHAVKTSADLEVGLPSNETVKISKRKSRPQFELLRPNLTSDKIRDQIGALDVAPYYPVKVARIPIAEDLGLTNQEYEQIINLWREFQPNSAAVSARLGRPTLINPSNTTLYLDTHGVTSHAPSTGLPKIFRREKSIQLFIFPQGGRSAGVNQAGVLPNPLPNRKRFPGLGILVVDDKGNGPNSQTLPSADLPTDALAGYLFPNSATKNLKGHLAWLNAGVYTDIPGLPILFQKDGTTHAILPRARSYGANLSCLVRENDVYLADQVSAALETSKPHRLVHQATQQIQAYLDQIGPITDQFPNVYAGVISEMTERTIPGYVATMTEFLAYQVATLVEAQFVHRSLHSQNIGLDGSVRDGEENCPVDKISEVFAPLELAEIYNHYPTLARILKVEQNLTEYFGKVRQIRQMWMQVIGLRALTNMPPEDLEDFYKRVLSNLKNATKLDLSFEALEKRVLPDSQARWQAEQFEGIASDGDQIGDLKFWKLFRQSLPEPSAELPEVHLSLNPVAAEEKEKEPDVPAPPPAAAPPAQPPQKNPPTTEATPEPERPDPQPDPLTPYTLGTVTHQPQGQKGEGMRVNTENPNEIVHNLPEISIQELTPKAVEIHSFALRDWDRMRRPQGELTPFLFQALKDADWLEQIKIDGQALFHEAEISQLLDAPEVSQAYSSHLTNQFVKLYAALEGDPQRDMKVRAILFRTYELFNREYPFDFWSGCSSKRGQHLDLEAKTVKAHFSVDAKHALSFIDTYPDYDTLLRLPCQTLVDYIKTHPQALSSLDSSLYFQKGEAATYQELYINASITDFPGLFIYQSPNNQPEIKRFYDTIDTNRYPVTTHGSIHSTSHPVTASVGADTASISLDSLHPTPALSKALVSPIEEAVWPTDQVEKAQYARVTDLPIEVQYDLLERLDNSNKTGLKLWEGTILGVQTRIIVGYDDQLNPTLVINDQVVSVPNLGLWYEHLAVVSDLGDIFINAQSEPYTFTVPENFGVVLAPNGSVGVMTYEPTQLTGSTIYNVPLPKPQNVLDQKDYSVNLSLNGLVAVIHLNGYTIAVSHKNSNSLRALIIAATQKVLEQRPNQSEIELSLQTNFTDSASLQAVSREYQTMLDQMTSELNNLLTAHGKHPLFPPQIATTSHRQIPFGHKTDPASQIGQAESTQNKSKPESLSEEADIAEINQLFTDQQIIETTSLVITAENPIAVLKTVHNPTLAEQYQRVLIDCNGEIGDCMDERTFLAMLIGDEIITDIKSINEGMKAKAKIGAGAGNFVVYFMAMHGQDLATAYTSTQQLYDQMGWGPMMFHIDDHHGHVDVSNSAALLDRLEGCGWLKQSIRMLQLYQQIPGVQLNLAPELKAAMADETKANVFGKELLKYAKSQKAPIIVYGGEHFNAAGHPRRAAVLLNFIPDKTIDQHELAINDKTPAHPVFVNDLGVTASPQVADAINQILGVEGVTADQLLRWQLGNNLIVAFLLQALRNGDLGPNGLVAVIEPRNPVNLDNVEIAQQAPPDIPLPRTDPSESFPKAKASDPTAEKQPVETGANDTMSDLNPLEMGGITKDDQSIPRVNVEQFLNSARFEFLAIPVPFDFDTVPAFQPGQPVDQTSTFSVQNRYGSTVDRSVRVITYETSNKNFNFRSIKIGDANTIERSTGPGLLHFFQNIGIGVATVSFGQHSIGAAENTTIAVDESAFLQFAMTQLEPDTKELVLEFSPESHLLRQLLNMQSDNENQAPLITTEAITAQLKKLIDIESVDKIELKEIPGNSLLLITCQLKPLASIQPRQIESEPTAEENAVATQINSDADKENRVASAIMGERNLDVLALIKRYGLQTGPGPELGPVLRAIFDEAAAQDGKVKVLEVGSPLPLNGLSLHGPYIRTSGDFIHNSDDKPKAPSQTIVITSDDYTKKLIIGDVPGLDPDKRIELVETLSTILGMRINNFTGDTQQIQALVDRYDSMIAQGLIALNVHPNVLEPLSTIEGNSIDIAFTDIRNFRFDQLTELFFGVQKTLKADGICFVPLISYYATLNGYNREFLRPYDMEPEEQVRIDSLINTLVNLFPSKFSLETFFPGNKALVIRGEKTTDPQLLEPDENKFEPATFYDDFLANFLYLVDPEPTVLHRWLGSKGITILDGNKSLVNKSQWLSEIKEQLQSSDQSIFFLDQSIPWDDTQLSSLLYATAQLGKKIILMYPNDFAVPAMVDQFNAEYGVVQKLMLWLEDARLNTISDPFSPLSQYLTPDQTKSFARWRNNPTNQAAEAAFQEALRAAVTVRLIDEKQVAQNIERILAHREEWFGKPNADPGIGGDTPSYTELQKRKNIPPDPKVLPLPVEPAPKPAEPEIPTYSFESHKPRKPFPIITAKEAAGNLESDEDRRELVEKIIVIDFTKKSHLEDANIAVQGVVVLTSNGQMGSLSHLFPNTDVDRFAQTLLDIHQSPCPVCLAGGSDNLSQEFIARLVEVLTQRGFTVSLDPKHSDVGGNVHRKVIIHPELVQVVREPDIPAKNIIELVFP